MQSWSGRLNGYSAYIYDVTQPIRAAVVNNMSSVVPSGDRELKTMARRYNMMIIDVTLDYWNADRSAQRVLDTLAAGANAFPDRPEIRYLNVVLMGFSAGSAGAAITASSPLLSNPDPTKAPQRVIAVATYHELDPPPYLPPAWTPHLFISDPGDVYGGLLTNVEGYVPATGHDAFARQLAAAGRPITVFSQYGEWHGGSYYGWWHYASARFLRFWTEAILAASLPAAPSTTGPVMAPDWRTYSGAWRASYDVAQNTGVQPWGSKERMVNVVTAPKDSLTGPRPYIWLPTQAVANYWQTAVNTGSLPAEYPSAATALTSFVRPGSDAAGRDYVDSPVWTTTDGSLPVPSTGASCAFSPSGDGNLIINYDRGVVSASAVATGAVVSKAPWVWGSTLVVPLKRTVSSPTLNVALTNIVMADGNTAPNLNVAAKYLVQCPASSS
ncbi:hypothetical protein [Methylocella sp.]|uniref:hypothetical protein n=1 Tax=Methylocella sp. TaxID=1978226 RepID=UPI0037843CA7